MSPVQQLEILEEVGFAWLDDIRTEKHLIEALCEMDIASVGTILWNDSLRIAPYLVTAQREEAKKIINTLFQLRVGPNAWTEEPWIECDFSKYKQMCFDTVLSPGTNTDLLEIYEWIKDNNQEKIREYLNKNYLSNCKFARFLLPM